MVEASKGRVLYVGQSYYNTWYLSRELRKMGWRADTLNTDHDDRNRMYYHGEDYNFRYKYKILGYLKKLWFLLWAAGRYDIFHFSGAWNMRFVSNLKSKAKIFGPGWDVKLLKKLGKKIVYSNNGCLDGVTPTSFRSWPGPERVCDSCKWQDEGGACSDRLNTAWGKYRNSVADYQCTLGGNRKDYNDDPRVHEVPEFYCLDTDVWAPDLLIPANYRLQFPDDKIKIYHSVGNYDSRTSTISNHNIKSTHIYLPTIEQLKSEGYNVELIFFKDVPNIKLRYYMAQADIVADMLTFGFFGATIREAMMLGRPTVCYLRPAWLESMRREIPGYVEELPVISATPATVYEVLKDLITNPDKRREIGRRSREFAVKWHAPEAGARRMARIYADLMAGRA